MINLDWKDFLKVWSQERCGLVLTDDKIIELPNGHPDPENCFLINSGDAEPYVGQIKAIWHTHCSDNYNLSMTDYAGFLEHPELSHIIISYVGVAEYIIKNNRVVNFQRRIF